MAKVWLEGDSLAIRVSWLERFMLAEKSRRIPLANIRTIDPHPRIVDLMVHWADQSAVWLGGVSAYDGHLIPSTRNPNHTLAIDVQGEDGRIFVELDEGEPGPLAGRIEAALREQRGLPPLEEADEEVSRPSAAQIALAQMVQQAQRDDDDDFEEEEVRRRDPLMQGSLPPPPPARLAHRTETLAPVKLENDRDLARLGGWLVALGSLGVLTGGTIVAAGLVPGLLAVGAGIACGLLGGVALAVVARHQD
jgi:hypothetical protein